MQTLKNQQRGVSFFGFILIAFVLVFGAILAMKLVPAYMHSAQLSSIFKSIAADSAMQSATIKDIKDSYAKRAMMNSISDITPEDIEIDKDGAMLSLSANYSVKIPLVANITLLLEFHPSSK